MMPVPTVNLPVHGSWEFLSPLGHVYDRLLKKMYMTVLVEVVSHLHTAYWNAL